MPPCGLTHNDGDPNERKQFRRFSMDQNPDDDDIVIATDGEPSFIGFFAKSSGPPQIVMLALIFALALGSTVGVVPAVMTDRYARLHHGFDQEDCSSFTRVDKPQECLDGSQDAQNASAIAMMISNFLTFTTSAVVGSYTDSKGRKGMLTIGIFLSLLSPLALVLIQLHPTMNPIWYYSGHACVGAVNWFAIALSSLSDIMPPKWRAPSFGILTAGFMCGFAFSPILAVFFSHLGISIVSFTILVLGFLFALVWMPETLPVHAREGNKSLMDEDRGDNENLLTSVLILPVRKLSILNRNYLFRVLSALAFFSGMVSAADHTLLIYYVEDQLDFNEKDISKYFIILGSLGMFVQAVVLKPLNECIGERFVLVLAFAFGALSNVVYGTAQSKNTFYCGLAVSTLGVMAFPTVSAIKSNNVEECEQGRIQGALYSLQSVASALGPIVLRYVYYCTKDYAFPGPGSMWLFAALLYGIAALLALALPGDQANSHVPGFKREYVHVDFPPKFRVESNVQRNNSYGSTDDNSCERNNSYGSIDDNSGEEVL